MIKRTDKNMNTQKKVRLAIWLPKRQWGEVWALTTKDEIKTEAVVERIFEEGLDGPLGALEKRDKKEEKER